MPNSPPAVEAPHLVQGLGVIGRERAVVMTEEDQIASGRERAGHVRIVELLDGLRLSGRRIDGLEAAVEAIRGLEATAVRVRFVTGCLSRLILTGALSECRRLAEAKPRFQATVDRPRVVEKYSPRLAASGHFEPPRFEAVAAKLASIADAGEAMRPPTVRPRPPVRVLPGDRPPPPARVAPLPGHNGRL
jgi:hypothetical protein